MPPPGRAPISPRGSRGSLSARGSNAKGSNAKTKQKKTVTKEDAVVEEAQVAQEELEQEPQQEEEQQERQSPEQQVQARKQVDAEEEDDDDEDEDEDDDEQQDQEPLAVSPALEDSDGIVETATMQQGMQRILSEHCHSEDGTATLEPASPRNPFPCRVPPPKASAPLRRNRPIMPRLKQSDDMFSLWGTSTRCQTPVSQAAREHTLNALSARAMNAGKTATVSLKSGRVSVKGTLGAAVMNVHSRPGSLDGLWTSMLDGEARGHISGAMLTWSDGDRSTITWHGDHALSMVVDGDTHTGVFTQGRIKWGDGDVWCRDDGILEQSRSTFTAENSSVYSTFPQEEFRTHWSKRLCGGPPVERKSALRPPRVRSGIDKCGLRECII